MKFISAKEIAANTPYPALIDALQTAFQAQFESPQRAHYEVGEGGSTMLVMPCWVDGDCFGLKTVSVVPLNEGRGLPTVSGIYQLFDANDGRLLALMDAAELTARRTAAASALASKFLSRSDSKRLLMVGTGKLAPYFIKAHTAVRGIEEVLVYGRNAEKMQAVCDAVQSFVPTVKPAEDLPTAVANADIISTATTSKTPIVLGEWLKEGVHLDLVGAYKPDVREVDGAAVSKASVFVDTYEGVMGEGGDILQAIGEGMFSEEDIRADLASLCAGKHTGRRSADEITLFKSVGAAIEDFAAAKLVNKGLEAIE